MPTPRDLRNISEALLQAGSTLNRTSKLIEAAEATTKKFGKDGFISAIWESGKLTIGLVEKNTSGYGPEFPDDLYPAVFKAKLPKEVAAFLRAEAANLVNEAAEEIQTKASTIQNTSKGFLSAGEATKLAAEKLRQAAILEETAVMCDTDKATVQIEGGGRKRPITSVCIKAKHVGHVIVNGRDHYDWGIQGACVTIVESYQKQVEGPCCPRNMEKKDATTVSIAPLKYYHGDSPTKAHPFVIKLCKIVSDTMKDEVLVLQGSTGPIKYQLTSK